VRFRVLNKPYLRALTTYPDLVIFKRQKPWVVIELKEQRQLSRVAAQKEWLKLIKARNALHPKRGYFIYVARKGSRKVLSGPKGDGARFFFEVPIVLEHVWTPAKIDAWKIERRLWARYVANEELS